MKTPKEIIDKYFPSGLHEDPEQSELNKIFIFNAMEEYASQFKSQSEGVGWISVKDRLPKNTNPVLCLPVKGLQFVGQYTKGHEIEYSDDNYQGEYDPIEDRDGVLYLKPGWYELEETPGGEYDEQYLIREVTHWQPLPPRPEVSVGEEKKD